MTAVPACMLLSNTCDEVQSLAGAVVHITSLLHPFSAASLTKRLAAPATNTSQTSLQLVC